MYDGNSYYEPQSMVGLIHVLTTYSWLLALVETPCKH